MSVVGEASLVLGLISFITVIYEGAHEMYEAASDVKGLPRQFRLAADQIPLVLYALSPAEENIQTQPISHDTFQSTIPILERCRESAAGVKDIFDQTIPLKDTTRTDRYKKALNIKLKSNKVKEYMEVAVKSMELLAQNHVFQEAEVLKDIQDAIEQLNNMGDGEELRPPHIVNSGSGSVHVVTGEGTMTTYTHSGHGDQYIGQKQVFVRRQGMGSS